MSDDVRRYECSGTLDHGDGTPPVACECVATQQHDGSITLDCLSPSDAPSPVSWWKGFFGAPIDAALFKGHVKNGQPVEVKGTLLGQPVGWNRDRGTRATFGLTGNSHFIIGSPDAAAAWRFAIANLVFDVPHKQRTETATGYGLSLTLAGSPVTISRVRDYDGETQHLHGRHSIRVTAEAGLPPSLSIESARDLADDLCSVLSIAQGTLVNWIFSEQRSDAGEVIFAVHRPAITRPYNGALPLIDPRRSEELPAFVEGVFDRFRDLKATFHLPAIARACADVRTTGFLETRSLQLLSTLEYVIGRNAHLKNREFIMDDDTFQKALGRLKPVIREVLRLAFPALGKQDANRMTEHLRGWNYTTFGGRLRDAAAAFGVQLDRAEVEALANTRNELVHRGGFATDEPVKEFQRIQSVVDRLLMGLLGYSGPYIDVRTFDRSMNRRTGDTSIVQR